MLCSVLLLFHMKKTTSIYSQGAPSRACMFDSYSHLTVLTACWISRFDWNMTNMENIKSPSLTTIQTPCTSIANRNFKPFLLLFFVSHLSHICPWSLLFICILLCCVAILLAKHIHIACYSALFALLKM